MRDHVRIKYKTLLIKLQNEVGDLGTVAVKAEKTGLPHEILDEDTQPLSEMTQVIASNRNRNRVTSLARINAALSRLENHPDEFGLCQECGEEIPAKRLELMPFAEFCALCQQDKDAASKGLARRRHLTDYK